MAIPLLNKPKIGTVRSPASASARSTTPPGPTGSQYPASGRFATPSGIGRQSTPTAGGSAPPIGFGGDGDGMTGPTPTRPSPAPGSAPGPTPPRAQNYEQWKQAILAAGAPYAPGDSGQIELEARDPAAARQRAQQMNDWRTQNLDMWRSRPGFTPGQGAVPNVLPAAELSDAERMHGDKIRGVEKFVRAWQLGPDAWAGAAPEVLALRDKIAAGPMPSLNRGKSGLANTAGNQWAVNPEYIRAQYGDAAFNQWHRQQYEKDGGTGQARAATPEGRAMTDRIWALRAGAEGFAGGRGGAPASAASTQSASAPAAMTSEQRMMDAAERRGLTTEQIQAQLARRADAATRRGATSPANQPGGTTPGTGPGSISAARAADPNRGKPGYLWDGRQYIYDHRADPGSEISQFTAANPGATEGDLRRLFPEVFEPTIDMGPGSPYNSFGRAGEGAAFRLQPGAVSTPGPTPPTSAAKAAPPAAPAQPAPDVAAGNLLEALGLGGNAGPQGGYWFRDAQGNLIYSSPSASVNPDGSVAMASPAPGSEDYLGMLEGASQEDLDALFRILGPLFGY